MDQRTRNEPVQELPVSPAAWASWLNVLLGIWQAASPWTLGYSEVSPFLLDVAVAVGIIIAIAGAYAALTWYTWPSWLNLLLGLWLIVSPFVLDYGAVTGIVAANDVIVGLLVVTFALIAGLSKPQTLISD